MQCCVCKDKPAIVHLTQILDHAAQTQHLCQNCAEARGVSGVATSAKWNLVFEPSAPPESKYVKDLDLSLLMNPLVDQIWLNKFYAMLRL